MAREKIHRVASDWTPVVHDLLRYLADRGFTRAPLPLGVEGDTEQVSYLEGQTVGHAMPWPVWTHSEPALVQVARWLRDYPALLPTIDLRPMRAGEKSTLPSG